MFIGNRTRIFGTIYLFVILVIGACLFGCVTQQSNPIWVATKTTFVDDGVRRTTQNTLNEKGNCIQQYIEVDGEPFYLKEIAHDENGYVTLEKTTWLTNTAGDEDHEESYQLKFDDSGRLLSSSGSDGAVKQYEYDPKGLIGSIKTTTETTSNTSYYKDGELDSIEFIAEDAFWMNAEDDSEFASSNDSSLPNDRIVDKSFKWLTDEDGHKNAVIITTTDNNPFLDEATTIEKRSIVTNDEGYILREEDALGNLIYEAEYTLIEEPSPAAALFSQLQMSIVA